MLLARFSGSCSKSSNMVFIPREEAFTCEHCDFGVQPLGKGTYRSHCPKCLYSKHVDLHGPGDRLNPCQGLMKPIGIDSDSKKGFVVMHECVKCGKVVRNRAAKDDGILEFKQNAI